MPDPLADRMAEALIDVYETYEHSHISLIGVRYGLGELTDGRPGGILRMTFDDVARVCARVAREEAVNA